MPFPDNRRDGFPRSRSNVTLSRVPSPCINTVIINEKLEFDSFASQSGIDSQHVISTSLCRKSELAELNDELAGNRRTEGKTRIGKISAGFLRFSFLVLRKEDRRPYLRRSCCSPRRRRTNRTCGRRVPSPSAARVDARATLSSVGLGLHLPAPASRVGTSSTRSRKLRCTVADS